ncbi:MAG: hypothetical protein JEZ03_06835 [Bacteroidales bacterium]|nr:hypothetical protein [Bacteroidales bacterium]
MKSLGNILWHFPFFGFMTALFTFLMGCFFMLTIVGAPIGLGLFQLAKFYLSPFSNAMVNKSELKKDQNQLWLILGWVVWIFYLPFGLMIFVVNLIQIVFLFVSIIGIPVALVLAKSLGTLLKPINMQCVPKAVADELEKRKAKETVDAHLSYAD